MRDSHYFKTIVEPSNRFGLDAFEPGIEEDLIPENKDSKKFKASKNKPTTPKLRNHRTLSLKPDDPFTKFKDPNVKTIAISSSIIDNKSVLMRKSKVLEDKLFG